MSHLATKTTEIASLSDKHCIFRCGAATFSLPANAVREIVPTPDVVSVPVSHDTLAGLGHVRNEFLPILNLEPMIGPQARVTLNPGQLLVLNSPLGPWGLLIDKVISIDVVETHVDAGHRGDSASILLGTASHHGDVLSVLDANGLHRAVQQALQSRWA